MKKLLLILPLLVALLAPVAAQQWTVTPGDGVGAISVGMTPSSLSVLVNPTRTIGKPSNPMLIEYGKELMVEFDSKKAVIISLHKNSFQTKNGPVSWVPYKGAAIGTSWNTVASQIAGRKISRALPTAKGHPKEDYHAFPSLGIGFQTRGGKIVKVDIWKSS